MQANGIRLKGGERLWLWFFLAPTLFGLTFGTLGPVLAAIGISFTKWDVLTAPVFTGLGNYIQLISDPTFLKSIANSDLFLKQTIAPIHEQVFLDAMNYAQVKPCFRGYNEWSTAIGDGMTPIWNGDADLKTTLDQIIPKADDILKNAQKSLI